VPAITTLNALAVLVTTLTESHPPRLGPPPRLRSGGGGDLRREDARYRIGTRNTGGEARRALTPPNTHRHLPQ
jgi:hypothetical protein